jgi:hypothetical protein
MQVLLRNPMDEFVIPFVEELCRWLPVRGSNSSLGHEGPEGEGKELDGLPKARHGVLTRMSKMITCQEKMVSSQFQWFSIWLQLLEDRKVSFA